MKIRPLGENVLVKPIEQEEKVGSIIIPDTAKEKPMTGEIVSVSDNISCLSAGETIMFGKYAGEEIEIDGKRLLIIPIDQILLKHI